MVQAVGTVALDATDMHRNLAIDITTDCNMECPWCIASDRKKCGTWTDATLAAFAAHIAHIKYPMYSFHGGESTLYPDFMFATMDMCRAANPNARLQLFTNGTLITPEMAEKLNQRNVKVCVSVNLTGAKGIENFVRHSVMSDRQFDVINSLEHCFIRAVALRLTPFAHEAAALHALFSCTVETMPDYTTLKDWTDDDISHIRRQLETLKGLAPDYRQWHILPCAFTTKTCDCSKQTIHFYADGTFGRGEYSSDRCITGCAMFQDQMGEKLYAQYQDLWTQYYTDRKENNLVCQQM